MKLRNVLILTLCCGMLSSCVADRLAFWRSDSLKKQYVVQGLEDDSATDLYVSTLIKSRVKNIEIENNEDYAQTLEYHEEALRRDVTKAMRSKGYYDAQVTFSDEDEVGHYNVQSGTQTRLSKINIHPKIYAKYLSDLPVSAKDALDSSLVLMAQSQLYKTLQKESCAFDLDVSHKALLNTKTNTAELTYYIKQGKPATFGDISFSGNKKTKESYLEKRAGWDEGACFRRDKIEAVREKFLGSGLFSRVDANLPGNVSEGGEIPVTFKLNERAQRSVKAGLSYYTDEGIGATFGWEHRNFLGGAEKLSADLTLSMLEQSIETTLTSPFFLRDDQSLSLHTKLDREDTEAYEELGIGFGAGIKRKINKRLSANIGTDFRLSRINEENEDSKSFALLSSKASLRYDSRDNTLDPHKGWLLNAGVEPFIDVLGESSPFVKTEASAQSYYELHDRVVIAGRVKLGSVAGTGTSDIPATERFFAGGGGSVRGFGYQEVGPYEDGDPAGGRSLAEGSLEVRYKMSDTLGAVAFIDAGDVSDQVFPEFKDVSLGAGLGLRYYTDFGPLRFDVGVPLSGDDNTDQNYQVYISIGQAF